MATIAWSTIRHMLARRLGDHTSGTATGGTVTTLLDATQRKERDNYWLGANCKVYSGTGSGQERPLSASTQSSGTLTHSATNWTAPDATSLYELHRLFTAGEYDEFLKESQRWHTRARKIINRKIDTSLMWTTDQFDYTVPTGFVAVERVELSTTTAAPGSDDYRFQPNDRWDIRQDTTRKLVFSRNHGQPVASTVIRITGYAEFADPTADSDTYNFDANPIVQLALVFATSALIGLAAHAHYRELHQVAVAEHDRLLARIPDVAFPSGAKIVEPL